MRTVCNVEADRLPTNDRDDGYLENLLLLGRYRALAHDWLAGLARGALWAAIPAGAILGYRAAMAWPAWPILLGWGVAGLLAGCVSVWAGRGWRRRYAEEFDRCLGAGDRISNAAEFLHQGDDDPFKRIAIREAESWIAQAGKSYVTRPWPLDARLVPLALVGLLAMLWVGGQR